MALLAHLKKIFGRHPVNRSALTRGETPQGLKAQGNQHFLANQLEAAQACYEKAIKLDPNYADAYVNLSAIYQKQAHYVEAKQALKQALTLQPRLWQAHLNLGLMADTLAQPEEAIQHYQQLLALVDSTPDIPQTDIINACHRLANLLLGNDKELQADNIEACHRLANLLLEHDQEAQALPVLHRLLTTQPNNGTIYQDIARAHYQLGQVNQAIEALLQALKLTPNNTDLHIKLYFSYAHLRDYERAGQHLKLTREIEPEVGRWKMNDAVFHLLLGQYEEGWKLYHEALQQYLQENYSGKVVNYEYLMRAFTSEKHWQGETLENRDILLWTDEGLGDNLMMLRYLPLLKSQYQARSITLLCERAFTRLAKTIPAIDIVLEKPDTGFAIPPGFHNSNVKPVNPLLDSISFDYHTYMMRLPYLFGTRIDSIPNQVPYLSVPETLRQYWANKLEQITPQPMLKVGLVWAGGKLLHLDHLRSMHLKQLEPLLSIPDICFVSLQKGEPAKQLKENTYPIIDWTDELHDLQDTAALMLNLDLIITVDTSMVHLAGGLGCQTWLLNRYESEWRWLVDREDSPWYPTVQVYTQPVIYDWHSVILKMKNKLETMV